MQPWCMLDAWVTHPAALKSSRPPPPLCLQEEVLPRIMKDWKVTRLHYEVGAVRALRAPKAPACSCAEGSFVQWLKGWPC